MHRHGIEVIAIGLMTGFGAHLFLLKKSGCLIARSCELSSLGAVFAQRFFPACRTLF
jgi:hypothetical protein